MKNYALLIPAYNPDEQLLHLLQNLKEIGIDLNQVLIVNDGSNKTSAQSVFQTIQERYPQLQIFHHAANMGKGAALKSGLNFIFIHCPQVEKIVTVDADGQHLPRDILRLLEQNFSPSTLLLGVRAFSGEVPLRSRFGNTLTRYIFKFFTGKMLQDTQTGLRVIPRSMVQKFLQIKSTGYEYELDMLLLVMNQGWQIEQLPIETVYIQNNRSSHFNPLLDSMRIYFVFLRFIFSSLCTASIDTLAFYVAYRMNLGTLVSMIVGRMVASVFNYNVNKRSVFNIHSKKKDFSYALRYLALLLVQGTLTYTFLNLVVTKTNVPAVAAKVVIEGSLFFASFFIQRAFIFVKKI